MYFGTDECFRFLGQKVKVQAHGGIKNAGNSTLRAEAYGTTHIVLSSVSNSTSLFADVIPNNQMIPKRALLYIAAARFCTSL